MASRIGLQLDTGLQLQLLLDDEVVFEVVV